MGQFILHRSEPRGAAAICHEAAMREREANAPGFAHENDSYRDLFWGCYLRRRRPLDFQPIARQADLFGVADWFSDRSAVSLRNILQIAIEQKSTGQFEN